ncbi:MAG: YtxH domain-containing protein [Clostridia bacterium]|nr:YtxH domain-containing protein [Clostridia bacterium]
MKFVKGMVIGAVGAAGIAMMYLESNNKMKRQLMKKGKQMAKKIGII